MNDAWPTPELEALLADAVSDELDAEKAAALATAVAADPRLADLLAEQRSVRALLTLGDGEGLDDIERRRLNRAIADETTRGHGSTRRRGLTRWIPSAAALLLVVVAGGSMLSNLTGGDSSLDEAAVAVAESSGGADGSVSEAADLSEVQRFMAPLPVDDLDEARGVTTLASDAPPGTEMALPCFVDDPGPFVRSVVVETPDGIVWEVVILADDTLVARPTEVCEPEVRRP